MLTVHVAQTRMYRVQSGSLWPPTAGLPDLRALDQYLLSDQQRNDPWVEMILLAGYQLSPAPQLLNLGPRAQEPPHRARGPQLEKPTHQQRPSKQSNTLKQRNKVQNKYNVLEPSPNYPQPPTPHPSQAVEKLSSTKQIPCAKKVGPYRTEQRVLSPKALACWHQKKIALVSQAGIPASSKTSG